MGKVAGACLRPRFCSHAQPRAAAWGLSGGAAGGAGPGQEQPDGPQIPAGWWPGGAWQRELGEEREAAGAVRKPAVPRGEAAARSPGSHGSPAVSWLWAAAATGAVRHASSLLRVLLWFLPACAGACSPQNSPESPLSTREVWVQAADMPAVFRKAKCYPGIPKESRQSREHVSGLAAVSAGPASTTSPRPMRGFAFALCVGQL